jgi:hypothetical protein
VFHENPLIRWQFISGTGTERGSKMSLLIRLGKQAKNGVLQAYWPVTDH